MDSKHELDPRAFPDSDCDSGGVTGHWDGSWLRPVSMRGPQAVKASTRQKI